jgi:ligand-binding sensor domain-containing protein
MFKQPIFLNFTLLFIQILIAGYAYGQEYSWKYYSVADGLPQTQVYCLYQDSKGYIWIGTKGGLSKFDGTEFVNYTTKDGLDFDFISALQEDSAGGMFITTRKGLNYHEDGKIKNLRIDLSKGAFNGYRYFFVDKKGVVWAYSATAGLAFFNTHAEEIRHSFLNHIKGNEPFFVKHIDHNELTDNVIIETPAGDVYFWDGSSVTKLPDDHRDVRLYFGKTGGLFGVSEDSLYFHENGKYTALLSIKDKTVKYIEDKNEIYLTDKTAQSKLFFFNGETVHQFHQKFNMVTAVTVDDEQNLWVGTESGLWRLLSKGFENYLSNRDDNFYTWSVTEDKHGNYLFASFLFGVKKFDGAGFIDLPVQHLFKDNGFQFFYSGTHVDAYGDIYLGTVQGILKYDGSEMDWVYRHYPGDAILHIYYDEETKHCLAASSIYGLLEFDESWNAKIHSERTPRANTGLETSVIKDKFGRIWLSGKQGISILEDGKWRSLPDEKDSIPIGAISMIKDLKGNLWLGSNDGLYYYDYLRLRQVAAMTFSQQIGVLNITNDNELLIGSIKGLGLLDLDAFYDQGEEHLRYFDLNNGFLGTECKHNSSYKDRKGNIWICTSDRVVKVNPKKLMSNPHPPRVYIEGMTTLSENNDRQSMISLYSHDTIYSFPPVNNDIRFNYHAISHSAPRTVRYQTMLEGYDDSWSGVTAERYRTYTNLPSGKYTFKVKAANSDGIWADAEASVYFEILPDWHELSSVRYGGILFMILAAAVFGFLYSEEMRKRKMIAEQNEKRIAKLQFKALRGLIDPHFTFNAINSIAAMVYKEDRDEAYNYFTKFSKLIRTTFDTSDDTTRTIKEELAFVTYYLDIEKMRFKDRFMYEIDVDRNVNHDWRIPKMIVQIYVENSIKHGLIHKETGGVIGVKMEIVNGHLVITIKDNGAGRKNTAIAGGGEGSLGKGTIIMADYFKLLNKFNDVKIRSVTTDLKDASGEPNGTVVQVFIPLNFKYNL